MNKRKPYKATGSMISSSAMAHMRRVAYTPVTLEHIMSESTEVGIIEKAMAKRQRKAERNLNNAK